MHPAAKKLNERLQGTIIDRMLSDLGKEFFFPKGIVAQAAEAAKRAHRFDATVGMAYTKGAPIILDAIKDSISGIGTKQIVGYSPTPGNADLRKRWLDLMKSKNPSLQGVSSSLPMVTPGLTNGLNHAADLFCNPGETLILPDLYWGNYNLLFGVRYGLNIVTYPFFTSDGRFNLDGFIQTIRENRGPRGVRILLNFPNNPTGYSPSHEEAKAITAALAKEAEEGDILLILDDAYFGLFYEEGLETESLFAHTAALHKNLLAVKIDGATKEDYVWGFRVGFFTIANPELNEDHYAAWDDKLIGSIRSNVSNGNTLGQNLLLKAMDTPGYAENKKAIADELRNRYLIVRKILSEAPYNKADFPLSALPFNAGYFMAFRCKENNAEQLRQDLLAEGIGTIAMGDSLLRVAYAGVDQEFLPDLYAEIAKAAQK